MRTILKVQAWSSLAIILTAGLLLTGCASTLKFAADAFDVQIVPETVQQNAYKAASVSFTAWEGVQDGVKMTGKLPRCTEAVKLLCVSQGAWEKIQGIEKQTSATLLSLRPAVEAGTDDVALLMSIPAIVHDAKQAITAESSK